jgi:hypothetical protein
VSLFRGGGEKDDVEDEENIKAEAGGLLLVGRLGLTDLIDEDEDEDNDDGRPSRDPGDLQD